MEKKRKNILSLFLLLIWHKQAISHYIPKLVTFWGQNRANAVLDTVEMNLASLCSFESPYSTIVVGYVSRYVDHRNEDFLPGMGFSVHCARPQDRGHISFLYCPLIGRDIRYCQQRGKKILIGIGGPGSPAKFESTQGAERFANLIWNLFLGGDETNDLRPFGSVILNGINFFMQNNDPLHTNVFIQTLDQLRNMDLSRRYLLTISPSCLFPDSFFGPDGEKILDISTKFIDESLKTNPSFRGFAIIDNSFDLQNLNDGFLFSKPLLSLIRDMQSHYQNHYFGENKPPRFREKAPVIIPVKIPIKVLVPVKVPVPYKVPVPVPAPYPVVQTTLQPSNVWTKPIEQTNEPTNGNSITTTTFQYPTEPIVPSTANPNDDNDKDSAAQINEDVDNQDDDLNNQILYPTRTTISSLSVNLQPFPENKTDEQDLDSDDLEESFDDDDDEEPDEDSDDEEKQYTVFDQASISEPTKKLATRRPPLYLPNNLFMKKRANNTQVELKNHHPIFSYQPFYKQLSKKYSTSPKKDVVKNKNIRNQVKKVSFDKKLINNSINTSIYRYSTKKSFNTTIYRYNTKQMKKYSDQNIVKNNKTINRNFKTDKIEKNTHSEKDLKTFLHNIFQPVNKKESFKSNKKNIYNILPREDKIDIIYDSPTKKDAVTGKTIKGTKMNIIIDVPDKKSKLTENVSNYGVSIKTTCGKTECNEYINPESFYKNRDDLFLSTNKLDNYKREIDLSRQSPNPIEELEEDYVESLLGRFAEDSDGDEVNEDETDLMSNNNINKKRNKLRSNPIEYDDQIPVKKQMEFRIPNVANSNSANGQMTLNDQMQENEKYLKLLQDDFQKQLDQFNNDIIKEQPVDPSEIDQNATFPYNVKESELEKIIKGDLDIGKVQLRDLISNVNVKGNMDHLKMLMSAMQNDINNANNAIIEREKNINEKQTENKNDKNAPKNFF
ncbi:putative leucine-rich repeat-containing protein DDB_G0290503 isoform X2 [Hydra vulgaris]|uniref:Leucine-rich repeat-containing protein DDB_G0290503 isoform X2 n=1 Tax=Hydra vulgaris TaxID=6087 RepID=A0ABM4BFF3_HYDVU